MASRTSQAKPKSKARTEPKNAANRLKYASETQPLARTGDKHGGHPRSPSRTGSSRPLSRLDRSSTGEEPAPSGRDLQDPRDFEVFAADDNAKTWDSCSNERSVEAATSVFGVAARLDDGDDERAALVRELRRLRAFDAIDDTVLARLGRLELHQALRELETAYIKTWEQLKGEPFEAGRTQSSEDQAEDDSARNSTRKGPFNSTSTGRAPGLFSPSPATRPSSRPMTSASASMSRLRGKRNIPLTPPEEQVARLVADKVSHAGLLSRQAFRRSSDAAAKVLATKVGISSVYHLNSSDEETARRLSAELMNDLLQSPEVTNAVRAEEKGVQERGVLSSLSSLSRAVVTIGGDETLAGKLRLDPSVAAGTSFDPCLDLNLFKYGDPPGLIVPSPAHLQLPEVTSLEATSSDLLVVGFVNGQVGFWLTGGLEEQRPRFLGLEKGHSDSVLACCAALVHEEDAIVDLRADQFQASSSASHEKTEDLATKSASGHVSHAEVGDSNNETSSDDDDAEVDNDEGIDESADEDDNGSATSTVSGHVSDDGDSESSSDEDEDDATQLEDPNLPRSDNARMKRRTFQIFTGSADKAIISWRLTVLFGRRRSTMESCEQLHVLDDHIGWVRCLALSRSLSRLYSGGGDMTVRMWDVAAKGPALKKIKVGEHWIQALELAHNDTLLLAASSDCSLTGIGLGSTTMTVLFSVKEAHGNWIRCMGRLSDSCVVTGSSDGTIGVWNVSETQATTDSEASTSDAEDKSITAVKGMRARAYSEDHRVVGIAVLSDTRAISASDDGQFVLWHLGSDGRRISPMTSWHNRLTTPSSAAVNGIAAANGHVFVAQHNRLFFWT